MCFALRHANWVLANSDNTKDTLKNLIGVDPQNIIIAYPTVDAERFFPDSNDYNLRHSIGLDTKKKLILSVGRLQPRKGFDNVIRALPLLINEGLDVEYALIGIGEELEPLQQLAKELGVINRVHFLEHVSYEDLPRWYNTCDLFAMPNRDINGDSEGFGLVFLEAAACEKPAIAGNAGGTGSAVVDGETGLRIDGEDIAEIVNAIVYVLRHPAEAKVMGNKARTRVLANFTHERRVNQLRDLISKS
jgi:phosphatidylinositol alpha-1,6-mannosyltransferase